MLDLNNYWLLLEEDFDNLSYVVENFEPLKFHVREIRGERKSFDKNLEGEVLSFERKNEGYLFKSNGQDFFFFEGLRQKGFDVRYELGKYDKNTGEFDDVSKMVTVDYEKKEYMEIWFKGKIKVEALDRERDKGIPYYRIKKS